MRAFALFYYILLFFPIQLSSLVDMFFSNRKGGEINLQKKLGLRGQSYLERVEARETVVWIYYMREEFIFN